MKKISKSLIAVATAFAVSTAGVTVATAAEDEVNTTVENTTVDASQNEDENAGNDNNDTAPAEETGSADLSSDMDPDDIRDWIGVFTAVIGALSALFTFVDRNF